MAYPGIQRGGVLKARPHTKSGGVVHFRSDIRKVGGGGGGGGNSLQVRYEKWGGGGGGSPLHVRYEKWGGGSPLQVRYLCLAHRKYLHVPTYVGILHTRTYNGPFRLRAQGMQLVLIARDVNIRSND